MRALQYNAKTRGMTRRPVRFLVFVMAISLAVGAFPGPAFGAAGFGDVEGADYFVEPVQWMVDHDITTGTSAGCFSPDRPVTRADFAVFLHRYAGRPAAGFEPFVDVAADAYYRDAIAWMVAKGITTGTSPTTFHGARSLSRGEAAAMLHRFAGSPAAAGTDNQFSDVPNRAFFSQPVKWMAHEGITAGTSRTTFEPDRPVTRGEAATFLYRLAGSPPVVLDGDGQCSSSQPDAADLIGRAEARSYELLNDLRASVGVGALQRDETMDDFARNWSRTMSESGVFAHSSGPYGENIVWWSNENLTPEDAAQRFHEMWVSSSGHYRNMTSGPYTTVGIGLWRDHRGWHGTHVFSRFV